MRKLLAYIVSVALLLCVMPTGLFSVTASAESAIVNVYDAQTLETALTTAHADIVLWNDITYSGSKEVLCHSIDLNGYKLTYSTQMTLATENAELVILDSLYSETDENNGKLEIQKGIYGPTSDVVFENGVVSVYNSNGQNGTAGEPGYLSYDGGDGSDGSSGSHGIVVNSLHIQRGKITIRGGNGGNGGDGGNGEDRKTYAVGQDAGNGGSGGNSGSGGTGVVANVVEIFGGVIEIKGGHGGNGGDGAHGGDGGYAGNDGYYGGSGGDGGNGGKGEYGGDGIIATTVAISGGIITVSAGNGGSGGSSGTGGAAGGAASAWKDPKYKGQAGTNGIAGSDGTSGCGIVANTSIIINDGELISSGGAAPEKTNPSYGGGAGIHGDLTVNGGSVYAYGKLNAAGIGGAGNAERKNGSNVTITGGYVFAQGGGSAFDIGGGYYNGVGTPGTLEVTGGTLEVATYGRATNISTPVFKNCTVTGDGAYQHEGTYNADGKFSVTVEDILIDPVDCVGYDQVTATAKVRISRTSNITTPKLKGSISFKLDGHEFATASITGADSADGAIIAAASAPWTAVEGAHRLSAEYIAGVNDMYAIGGTYAESTDIPLHTHEWDSEYTIDVQPTCTIPGSKSIHCGICDVQKDFAEVDAIGHDYANNQCQNCQEFLPLIIFKDYDGTVWSSEYYYLGDSVIEPDAPSREKDNTYTYAFVGWDKEVTACEGDTVYTAVYESTFREYTVVFKNYDGSELLSNTYHYGDAITLPSDIPQKPADSRYTYVFSGWDPVVCPCDGNKVYTAVFTTEFIEYTVTFKNSDGTILSQRNYHYGDKVTVPADPTKASDNTYTYTFAGWDKAVVNCSADATYTATYTPNYIDYTVVFKDWDGTVLSSRVYHYGDAVQEPNAPTKSADNTYTYTFAGWDKAVVNCVGNATYTATYTPTHIDYTVVFKNYDGTVLSSKTYHYGDTVIVPNTPTKPADNMYTYTFAGWDSSVVPCNGNKVYTATYTSNFIDYIITFRDYDGTVLSSRTYHYGDAVIAPNTPTKAADDTYTYTFAGWDSSVVACDGDKVYIATYTPKFIDYTVTFKNYDGAVLSSKAYHYGDAVQEPNAPTKSADNTYAYTFAGWDKAVVNCVGNVTYTATYTPTHIDYTVVFKNYDGTVLSSKVYHYGDAVQEPNAPTKSADNTYTYTFAGWDKAVVNCAGDATYTATYTPNYIDYTVVFKNYDGTVLSSKAYHYGDIVQEPNAPIKAADNTYTYTFVGWDKAVVNCAGDATYTATYTPNHIDYTIVFKDWDGTVISSNTYHWGDTIHAPTAPIRPYDEEYIYTFAGWDKVITSCNGDAVYTAVYDKTKIVITSIAVTTLPNELTYIESTMLDDTGMVLTLYYNNDTSETVTTGWVSEYDFNTVGTATVTVTYNGKTTTYDVEIIAKTLTHLVVTTKPNKLTYTEGEAFDTTGMVVTAYYNNDTSADITDYTISGDSSTPGAKTVTVSYGGFSDTFDVVVEAKKNGWVLDGENWLYYINGEKATGWQYVNDNWYYLNGAGVMQTGWLYVNNTWYYLNAGGAMATGWQYIGGSYYYLNESGAMQTGWLQLGGTWYYLNAGGAMVTGWQYIGNTYYYFAESGAMQTGWLQLGGTWYYLNAGGAMVTGWQYIGNTYYYFAESGAMYTGWLQLGGTWYFLADSGAMQTGWQMIGGVWYYFYDSGAMATNCWIGNYWINAGGVWVA